jgi:polyisoprenoid-binding protein YceI
VKETAMLRTLLATAAILAAPAAFAQDWVLDREASTVGFETTVFGQPASGEFSEFDAAITLDPDDLAGARIEARVTVSSGTMSNRDYQTALRSPDGLDPAAHPQARFVSDDVSATDAGYEARGTLTIRGQETEAVLPFTLQINGARAVADGEMTVDRSAFGVGGSGWGDVGEQVTIRLHVEADAG